MSGAIDGHAEDSGRVYQATGGSMKLLSRERDWVVRTKAISVSLANLLDRLIGFLELT
ncbi:MULTISPECIES: hypothetical protein [Streptomyces violaceusniger group]|uniref:Uncharacterized protein n=2 Tax=Streptomyces rhizosphaericus TaxID=114699 RepID=A0ABP4CQ92_9ACTN|nr:MULTISPECIES: hypothetical protein [Streptomyces violaceusniger group]